MTRKNKQKASQICFVAATCKISMESRAECANSRWLCEYDNECIGVCVRLFEVMVIYVRWGICERTKRTEWKIRAASSQVQMTFIGIKSIYRILFFGRTRVFFMRQPFRCDFEFDLSETENVLSVAAWNRIRIDFRHEKSTGSWMKRTRGREKVFVCQIERASKTNINSSDWQQMK